MLPVGKNLYVCSFRHRLTPGTVIAVDAKDIRTDHVRNTTRGHQVVFLFMMLSERFPVIGGKHPLNVRLLVENLAAQLVVGYHTVVTVLL